MKKLLELIKECREKGIPVPDDARVSKEDLILKLANHHLERNPTDIPPLEQVRKLRTRKSPRKFLRSTGN